MLRRDRQVLRLIDRAAPLALPSKVRLLKAASEQTVGEMRAGPRVMPGALYLGEIQVPTCRRFAATRMNVAFG